MSKSFQSSGLSFSHQPAKCDYCQKVFSRHAVLKRHNEQKHSGENLRSDAPSSRSVCDYFSFTTPKKIDSTDKETIALESDSDNAIATDAAHVKRVKLSTEKLGNDNSLSSVTATNSAKARLSKFAFQNKDEQRSSDPTPENAAEAFQTNSAGNETESTVFESEMTVIATETTKTNISQSLQSNNNHHGISDHVTAETLLIDDVFEEEDASERKKETKEPFVVVDDEEKLSLKIMAEQIKELKSSVDFLGTLLKNKLQITSEENLISKKNENEVEDGDENNVTDLEEYIQPLKECKTPTVLFKKLNNFHVVEADGYAYCLVCSKYGRIAPSDLTIGAITSFKSYGSFKLPTEEQDVPGPGGGLSQKFRNFRRNIINHIKHPVHVWYEGYNYMRITQREVETVDEKNWRIGINVIRIAYSAVKEGKGGQFFERQLSLQNLNGVETGEINNSTEFYSSIRKIIFEVIKTKIIKQLTIVNKVTNQLPLFSITADKITIQSRTLQITCISVMVGGSKRVILIDLVPCGTSQDGKHLTELLISSLEEFELSLKKQFTGMAFDGQYFHLSVPKRIASIADLTEDFLAPQWDLAHQIELAIADSKKEKPWLANQVLVVGGVMTKFKWGIGYEEFINLASELGLQYLKPKGFQVTKFVQSELRVYRTFLKDFSIFFTYYGRKYAEADLDKDNAHAKDCQGLIMQFSKVQFLTQLLFTVDILEFMTKFNCESQKVDIHLWNIYEKFSTLIPKLEKIHSELLEFKVSPELELLYSHFEDLKISRFKGNCLDTFVENRPEREVVEEGTRVTRAGTRAASNLSSAETGANKGTNDIDISNSSTDNFLSENLKLALKNASNFIDSLVTDLTERIKEPLLVKDMRNCFSWLTSGCLHIQNQKCGADSEIVPHFIKESLEVLLDLTNKSRGTKFILEDVLSQMTFLWINLAHLPFIVKIKELPKPNSKEFYKVNEKILQFIFTDKEIYSRCRDFLFLFENYNKLTNETICETVGSVIGSQLYNRTLETENLAQEVFIRWNGPKLEEANNILSEALRIKFIGFPSPHFTRVTKQKSLLKSRKVSKVVDRIRANEDRLPFLSTSQ